MKKPSKKTVTHIAAAAITLGVGGLAALVTKKNMNTYKTVIKPPLAPPPAAFPIAWTALYILMSIAFSRAFLACSGNRKAQDKSITLYGVNLFMNFLWPIIFFNFRAFLPALVWLIGLFGVVCAMTADFGKKDKISAYLLIPYLLWLAFAGYLNAGIVYLN